MVMFMQKVIEAVY